MMRLPSLLVLSLVLVAALVSSAPVEKSPEQKVHAEVVEVAKRDQEMILFGNQQNDPRLKKKKSDPGMPVISGDDTEDKQGYIEVAPANYVEAQLADNSVEQTADVADVSQEQTAESAEAELPPIKQQVPEEETIVAEAEPVADVDSVEEELKDIMAGSAQEEAPVEEIPVVGEVVQEIPAEEVTDAEEADNEVPEESEVEATEVEVPKEEAKESDLVPAVAEEENPLEDLYYYMLENEKARNEPQPGDYYYDLGMYPGFRRRRSSRHARAVTEGGMIHNDELQRSKRIKRDLFEDDEGYYYPYEEEEYTPDVSEADLYGLYRVEPKYEDDVASLLDMYQQAPDSLTYEPYEAYPVEEVYPELYEEALEEAEEPEYVPTKRQMMSSLPGIKKRYFYPFSREPETHWGAFVPEQKRDYDQTYRRLLALASALSEESPYYQAYRRK